MSQTSLNPADLLASKAHRLTLQAILAPTGGRDRIQPAGFPEIGHVIYESPIPVLEKKGQGDEAKIVQKTDELGQPMWTTQKVCIIDSAASMANHLETVCHAGRFGMDIHPDLEGLPYVQCVTDDEKGGRTRLVVTSLSEGHRLASSLFTDKKSTIESPTKYKGENLGEVLHTKEFKMEELGKRSHPLPEEWWNVFKTIFTLDPNSLVHGILFPAMGIKIPRALTAQLDAIDAARVTSSGVKFDKLLMTTSGQPIFAKDEETATEIRATFVLDLSLIRSFGRGDNGLSDAQKTFLIGFALWKITELLQNPFAYRSGCDLEFKSLSVNGEPDQKLPEIKIGDLLSNSGFAAAVEERVTKVYWKSEELFKKAKDKLAKEKAAKETKTADQDEDEGDDDSTPEDDDA